MIFNSTITFFNSRYLPILLGLLIFLVSNNTALSASRIFFTADRYRTRTPIHIDSIKIIDNSSKTSFTTRDSSIKKSVFTNVDDSKSESHSMAFSNLIYYFDSNGDLLIINKGLTISGMDLRLYDLFGRIILHDKREITDGLTRIALNEVPGQGVYFIVSQSAGLSSVKKVINLKDDFSYTQPAEYMSYQRIEGLESYSYDFIGYSFGFRPDTLKDIDPTAADTLSFMFYDDALNNFKTGSIRIDSLRLVLKKHFYDENRTNDQLSDTTFIDTVFMDFSFALTVEENVQVWSSLLCQNILNHDSTIVFCNAMDPGEYGFVYGEGQEKSSMAINNSDSTINGIYFDSYYDFFIQISENNSLRNKSYTRFLLNGLIYNKDETTGVISVNSTNIADTSIFNLLKYNWYQESHGPCTHCTHIKEYSLISYIVVPDKTRILLELNP